MPKIDDDEKDFDPIEFVANTETKVIGIAVDFLRENGIRYHQNAPVAANVREISGINAFGRVWHMTFFEYDDQDINFSLNLSDDPNDVKGYSWIFDKNFNVNKSPKDSIALVILWEGMLDLQSLEEAQLLILRADAKKKILKELNVEIIEN